MTIPPNTITEPGQTINAYHRVMGQLVGKTVRKAVFNTVTVEGATIGELMVALNDGSVMRVSASGSVRLELLP